MMNFLNWLTTADRHGDTPLGIAAAVTVFMACLAIIMAMPGL